MLVNVKNIGDAVSCEVINKIYTDVVQVLPSTTT